MNIEGLFTRGKVCISCKYELLYNEGICQQCQSADHTRIATIYDVDLVKVLPILLERLHTYIHEYKQKILKGDDTEHMHNSDVPFCMIYKMVNE